MTTINLFVFPGPQPPAPDMETIRGIAINLEILMTQVAELTTALQTLNTQLEKARTEIVGRLAQLETALASLELPPDAVAALQQLQTAAQALDDIIPDAVPPVA